MNDAARSSGIAKHVNVRIGAELFEAINDLDVGHISINPPANGQRDEFRDGTLRCSVPIVIDRSRTLIIDAYGNNQRSIPTNLSFILRDTATLILKDIDLYDRSTSKDRAFITCNEGSCAAMTRVSFSTHRQLVQVNDRARLELSNVDLSSFGRCPIIATGYSGDVDYPHFDIGRIMLTQCCISAPTANTLIALNRSDDNLVGTNLNMRIGPRPQPPTTVIVLLDEAVKCPYIVLSHISSDLGRVVDPPFIMVAGIDRVPCGTVTCENGQYAVKISRDIT